MNRVWLPVAGLLMALAGCASHAPPPTTVTEYVCEGARGFQLRHASDAVTISISGMQFGLQASSGAPGERVYACNMLKFTQQGELARVEMEGQPYLEHCRLKP